MEFTLEEIKKAFFLTFPTKEPEWLSEIMPIQSENDLNLIVCERFDDFEKNLLVAISKKELWKVDFNEYLRLVNEAKIKILTSPDLYRRPLKYWPDLNVQKSLERSIENFWGTDAGWKLKIKQSKKVKKFDMVETLLKNIDKNKVFKNFRDYEGDTIEVLEKKLKRVKSHCAPDDERIIREKIREISHGSEKHITPQVEI